MLQRLLQVSDKLPQCERASWRPPTPGDGNISQNAMGFWPSTFYAQSTNGRTDIEVAERQRKKSYILHGYLPCLCTPYFKRTAIVSLLHLVRARKSTCKTCSPTLDAATACQILYVYNEPLIRCWIAPRRTCHHRGSKGTFVVACDSISSRATTVFLHSACWITGRTLRMLIF